MEVLLSSREQVLHAYKVTMGKVDGKVATITVGRRGIGRAIAEGFRNEGAALS
jgi:hypothetical protein